MPFKKGQSGNPGGRKRSNYRKMLDDALASDTKTHHKSLLKFAVEKARTDSTVLNAILKKILPDLKSVEAKIDSESPFRLILEYKLTSASDKSSDKVSKRTKRLLKGTPGYDAMIGNIKVTQTTAKTVAPSSHTDRGHKDIDYE